MGESVLSGLYQCPIVCILFVQDSFNIFLNDPMIDCEYMWLEINLFDSI